MIIVIQCLYSTTVSWGKVQVHYCLIKDQDAYNNIRTYVFEASKQGCCLPLVIVSTRAFVATCVLLESFRTSRERKLPVTVSA